MTDSASTQESGEYYIDDIIKINIIKKIIFTFSRAVDCKTSMMLSRTLFCNSSTVEQSINCSATVFIKSGAPLIKIN